MSHPKAATVKHAVLDLLRGFGMTTVFGNPGSTELPFLSDWPDDLDYVLGLQEASVIGMADGYAQATRNAAFVNLHAAAGTGHALGAVFTAFRNQTPLVITAGQQARSILPLQPFLFAERAAEFPQPYVKWSVEPGRAADVPAAIARAYYIAMQPPCGPTFVSIPIDDWDQPADPVVTRVISRDHGADGAAINRLAAALSSSRSPALVVGPEVDKAGAVDLMVRLAEQTRAQVWVSPFSHRCSFPETHRQFAGFLHASPSQLSETLRGHDLVVVIGAPVFTFHVEGVADIFHNGTALFQITADPVAASVAGAGTSIIATMTSALEALLAALPPMTDRALPLALPPARVMAAQLTPAPDEPISAAYLMQMIAQTLPRDAVIAEEIPSHRPVMQAHLPMRGQDSFYTMASGGLGYALPAAVGLALARPERRTICLIGDGSAMYSFQALWTAAQRKLPLTVVVVNNSGYGAMRAFSQVMQVRNVPGLDLPGLDFVALANGVGARAERVDKVSELGDALARGFAQNSAHDGTCLIEVIVDSSVPVLYKGT